ncbi:hypothetical protein AQ476_12005 [Burkholderia thailandensis]|nr:hypothetical protein AQ476_12005 [Burkholderia thailandensis]
MLPIVAITPGGWIQQQLLKTCLLFDFLIKYKNRVPFILFLILKILLHCQGNMKSHCFPYRIYFLWDFTIVPHILMF